MSQGISFLSIHVECGMVEEMCFPVILHKKGSWRYKRPTDTGPGCGLSKALVQVVLLLGKSGPTRSFKLPGERHYAGYRVM